jgi:hypothetical protein
MNGVEWTFSLLGITVSVTSVAILLMRDAHREEFDERSRDDYVGDIRAMNTYNSYFMTAIVVFFGFVFGATSGGRNNDIPHSALTMLSLAFVAAASAMYYVPVRKTSSTTDSNDRNQRRGIHGRWLAAIICSQLTVILCVFGVLNIVVSHFASDRARGPNSISTLK